MHHCHISNLNALFHFTSSRLCILANLTVGSTRSSLVYCPLSRQLAALGASSRTPMCLVYTIDQARTMYSVHCQIAQKATTGCGGHEIVHLTSNHIVSWEHLPRIGLPVYAPCRSLRQYTRDRMAHGYTWYRFISSPVYYTVSRKVYHPTVHQR